MCSSQASFSRKGMRAPASSVSISAPSHVAVSQVSSEPEANPLRSDPSACERSSPMRLW